MTINENMYYSVYTRGGSMRERNEIAGAGDGRAQASWRYLRR